MLLAVLSASAKPAETVSLQAMERLERYGPHVATYTKIGSGELALEIRYHSPLEASLRVHGPEGEYALSVDRDHIRFFADGTCAAMPMEPMLASVDLIRIGEEVGEGLSAQLNYRILPGAQATMTIAFGRTEQPVPLAWLADLDADGAALTVASKEWQATLDGTSWSVSQKTGVLSQMTADESGLELATLARLPKGPLPPICTGATDPILASQFASLFLLPAYLDLMPEVLVAWPDLDEAARARALSRQEQFWQDYFAAELPSWVAGLRGGPWVAQVTERMSNPESFAAFSAQLPAAQQPDALLHWQQLWYADAGNALLGQHVQEVAQGVLGSMSAGEPGARAAAVAGPLEAGAIAAAEEAMRPMLTEAVEQGAAALEARR